MSRVLIAGVVAMVIGIVLGPRFIEFLRRNQVGQHIREEGPARHQVKQGTPVMGGLLILVAALVPYLILTHFTEKSLTVLGVTVSCGAIGFMDDFAKLRRKRSLGLSGRWKLVLLALVTGFVAFMAHRLDLDTSIYVPIVKWAIPLSYAWYPFLFVIIAGAANGVNLTDGLDGLAGGTSAIALVTFTTMSVLHFIRSGPVGYRSLTDLDLAILGVALVGGTIGFLWYNAFPAEVFMGDTGSMALGGALGAFAIMTKTEFLLLLIGGIFLIEALSVMIQVFSYRRWGRRVFLMAPIHHHFEMKAWSETKIMVRFWVVSAILCALAFVLYYRYYIGFRI